MAAKEREKKLTAIVVGAGAGGIALAARLAKSGFEVTVVEKNSFTGGRCSLIHRDGHRFDVGPSLLLLPQLFHEQFHDLDTTLEAEGVTLLKCDPNYLVWFGDGSSFELSTDLSRMKTSIEAREGKDGFERYLSFLRESHRHYELSVTHVLHRNFSSLLDFLRPSFLPHLFTLHPFESIYSRASRYFWTDRLRRVFTFGSMYMGMSPFDAPATYSLLQYAELAEGIWYPEGGFHAVLAALVRVGERLGVEYRLSSPVSSIDLSSDGSRATGITLATGEKLRADVVVNNADLVYAYNSLLPATSQATSLSKRAASCSSISFYWALSAPVPQLQAHNIFLADEYRESFDDIFTGHTLPTHPSFYVNVPSRVDPSAAPAGRETVVVLCPVGHLSPALPSSSDWTAVIDRARTAVLSTVKGRTGVDLAPLIASESVNAPLEWRDAFNLDKGAILGLSHSFFNVLSFRPKTRHAVAKNLYFVGASTHPGTGVPIVLAGSRITAEQILGDFGLTRPWGKAVSIVPEKRREGATRSDVSALDFVEPPGIGVLWMILYALIGLVISYYGPGVVLEVLRRLEYHA